MEAYQIKTRVIQAMAMPFSIKVVLSPENQWSQDQFDQVVMAINRELRHVDEVFSPFKSTSILCRFQQGELAADDFSSEFQSVYGLAIRAQTVTQGAFDPFYRGPFDPTGLVKGWAIEQVFRRYLRPLLVREVISAAAINGAGDIQMGVAATSDFRWAVGVQDPNNRQQLLAQYQIANGAMATSGTSQHGEHISRLNSQRHLQQATVVSADLVTADVWATAAISAGPEKFKQLTQGLSLQSVLVDGQDKIVHS